MKVTITARKFKARESLKAFISEEVQKLNKFSDDIHEVETVLSFQANKEDMKIVDIMVLMPGATLMASDSGADYEVVVRNVLDKIIRQIKKIKTKKEASVKQKAEL